MDAFKPKHDFAPPPNMSTTFNLSEIITGFLYLGAGYDVNGRCLTNREGEPTELRSERITW